MQIFKENLVPITFKFLHKNKEEGTLSNRFCETRITLIPKPESDKKNHRSVSLMYIQAFLGDV